VRALARAYRKRELRAERRHAEVLAGGWGRGPQEAAWDALLPGWRELVKDVGTIGDPEAGITRARRDELIGHFQALPRYVRRPWYRLLMQTIHRFHDEAGHAPALGWWGGYPLR
jgi:hypothetical protein